MTEDALAPLKVALGRGECLLVIGQDHSPEIIDQVLVDAKEVFTPSREWNSLPDLYTSVAGDESARKTIMALFEKHQPSVALLELASIPWMSVITSAVDGIISHAFLSVGSQRRVVELGPHQLTPVSVSRAAQLLYFIRAFGVPEADALLMAPTSAPTLAQARLVRFPAVISALPRLVGLHGHVVIEGVSSRDWFDEQALATLCVALATLPAGRVFWFGPADAHVRAALAGKAHFEELSLPEHLRSWVKDEYLQRDLRQARDRVFGIGERSLTIEQDGRRTQVHLTAQEWRSIARIGSILDDLTLVDLRAHQRRDREDLVAYLRRSHAGVPDWSGPARGFVFEREQVANLVREVRAFVGERKASILDFADDTRGVRRVPFLLSGPPASGKTLGLLSAAWTLRARYDLCVLWLLPGIAGLDIVAIERVCRLLESKGVRWTVLFLDSTDLEDYFRLKRRLEAEGRRILVVGSESRFQRQEPTPDDESAGETRRFPLVHEMTPEEVAGLRTFLSDHQLHFPTAAVGSRDFLSAFSAAVPEAQFGALPSLLDEYEQILKEARQTAEERDRGSVASTHPFGSLAEQLQKLFPNLAKHDDEQRELVSRFRSDPILRDLLNLVLFCAQLDRPIAVDFLFRVLGSDLISKYPTFARAFSDTALVQEVDLDQEGTVVLTTGHQLYAIWLLRGLFPDRTTQLDLLRRLAISIDWDPDAYPGDNPSQDFVMDVMKSVGPRGEYRHLYGSISSLDRLRSVIGEVRERFGIEQPKLLALEAIILGDLAVRDSTQAPDEAPGRCRLALELLGRAEDLLRMRKPSDVRTFELQRVLTLASDIRGTLVNTMLRGHGVSMTNVQEIFAELTRIEEVAIRVQSYSPTYHALDIVCWAHRDAFDLLPQSLDAATRVRLLETIESTLEVATEEPLDPSQLQRYKRRQQELQFRLGNRQLSADLAREMRQEGDFAGELSLARDRLREFEHQGDQMSGACLVELKRLYSFRPQILGHPHAVRFLHGLWARAFLDGKLGEGPPRLVKATMEEWRMLEEVTRTRIQFAEYSELPYALFFLGWSLYQLDEPREAREIVLRLERQSLGNPRRVGELVYLSDGEGHVRVLRAKVIHARAGQVRVSVPELNAGIMDLRPEVETRIAPAGLRLGEFVEVSIALNYRGAQARPPGEINGRER